MATRWLVVGAILLASGGAGCGRTDLSLSASDAGSGNPSRQPIADAGLVSDLAPLSIPDLAPPLGPDLAPDLRNPNCGNGKCDPGEECDDGNTLAGDGCGATCLSESGWGNCLPYTRVVICGDGVLSPAEVCDDGNVDRGDGCSDVCEIEPGFRCTVPGDRCSPICGDRMIMGLETCDDGNTASGDGCSEWCLTEDCWDCTSGVCLPQPPGVDGGNCQGLPVVYCGNGRREGAEECDEGADNNDRNYGGCSTHCRYLVCGDGVVSEPEQCDLGSARNTAVYGDRTGCTSTCALPHYCGDYHVDSHWGEDCDEGELNGLSICSLHCRIWMP